MAETSKGTVLLQEDGPIARITLSNPDRYNAMSLAMWLQLGDIMEALDKRDDIRVVLLRGAGEKSFVSGADISEFGEQRNNPENVKRYNDAVDRAQGSLIQCSKPVVARIQGVCMGGGMGLAVSCDLRYATHGTRFRMPAARLGLGYGFDGLKRLVDLIGPGNAAEAFYTADTFDGKEAQRIGLVQRALDDAELDAMVERVLASIAGNAPLTVEAAKYTIGQILRDPQGRDLDGCARKVQACFDSADYIEGQNAFAEKRPPRFIGK